MKLFIDAVTVAIPVPVPVIVDKGKLTVLVSGPDRKTCSGSKDPLIGKPGASPPN